MTRIGFAYNQKPDPIAAPAAELARADEEPPSSGAAATLVAPTTAPDDEYAEWDSAETIAAVERALARHGEVVRLEATDDFPQRLRDARPDIVFNIAEGLRGPNREAHVPAICEFYGIPYSGSDPFTLTLCLDKARTKEILRAHDIPTADWWLVRSAGQLTALEARPHGFPLFAKPVHEGSSKGITERNVVAHAAALRPVVLELLERYQQPVLVETFLPGAEFTCGVLGNGAEARVLPLVGMNFDALPAGALPIYGFEAKWLWDRPDEPLPIFECPARITPALRAEIEQVVLRSFEALGCRDWARIDVRLDAAGRPTVVEVNPLPGILPDPSDNSCLPKAARAAGLDYDALIGACLQAAAARHGVPLEGGRA
ncbi:MAG: D-alanine--D-alanine ligase [Gemmatimonadaceae bacterium]|nr:D-alanine--D-alanine ligase [Gemmatimonadaceae bacterium]NUT56216.1 D-alanine--D-alanine ligase [Thermoleophilia bacterium]